VETSFSSSRSFRIKKSHCLSLMRCRLKMLASPPRRADFQWQRRRRAMLSVTVLACSLGLADGLLPVERQHLTKLACRAIEFYQTAVSPRVFHGRKVCRFSPSCSEYTKQVLQKYGLYAGSAKAAWRLARCNPMAHGGVDLP